MACKPSSLLALVLFSTMILATTWQGTVAGRHISPKNSNTEDKKEPQFFFSSDGGFYIPGIGRVALPPFFGFTPQNPNTGGIGIGPGGGGYVPGGDDTFVPNPGFEVPIPGSGGAVPATP